MKIGLVQNQKAEIWGGHVFWRGCDLIIKMPEVLLPKIAHYWDPYQLMEEIKMNMLICCQCQTQNHIDAMYCTKCRHNFFKFDVPCPECKNEGEIDALEKRLWMMTALILAHVPWTNQIHVGQGGWCNQVDWDNVDLNKPPKKDRVIFKFGEGMG